jgi:serine/threonine-protein kinase RsbW
MGEHAKSKMVIASKTSEVAAVKQQILDQAQARGYAKRDLFSIRLALEEALSNAIHHGNGDDPTKHITIEYAVEAQQTRITISDEGGGFTPEQLPDPCCEQNLAHPNGRGVMLMKAYMDEVHFHQPGNRVTLVKRREPAEPADD